MKEFRTIVANYKLFREKLLCKVADGEMSHLPTFMYGPGIYAFYRRAWVDEGDFTHKVAGWEIGYGMRTCYGGNENWRWSIDLLDALARLKSGSDSLYVLNKTTLPRI